MSIALASRFVNHHMVEGAGGYLCVDVNATIGDVLETFIRSYHVTSMVTLLVQGHLGRLVKDLGLLGYFGL